jgi:rhamnose utilization protein RhaD (predicted bifunctional aldolase and dehydrogenase)
VTEEPVVDQKQKVLEAVLALSHRIGEPERDLVILGEGNTSAKIDDSSFYVKASGCELATMTKDEFVEVSIPAVLDVIAQESLTDDQVKTGLANARKPGATLVPSVETTLHAMLLNEPGINFVAHTHPTAVNSLLCSVQPELLVENRLYPDDIVVCGRAGAYVPYTDPGLALAKAVRQSLDDFTAKYGTLPKFFLIQNHGLIALGCTAKEVEAITYTHVKACRVALGALAAGGIHFLSAENVDRIATRPDEAVRIARIHGRTDEGTAK